MKIDDIFNSRTNLNKFKRMVIIQSIFSDHNGIKLEINNRKICRLKTNTLLNNPWLKILKIKKKKNLMKMKIYQNMWNTAKAVLRNLQH